MYDKVRNRLDPQFERAELEGACFVPACRNDARILRKEAEDVSGIRAVDYRRDADSPSEYVSPFPGLYLRGGYWSDLHDDELALHVMKGLALKHPSWTFCSYSAALLYGIDVSWELLDDIHLACPKGRRTKDRQGIIRHSLDAGTASFPNGVRAVDVREAVLGALCSAPFELGLGIVDSALRLRSVTKEGMEAYCEVVGKGRRGIARARAVISFADGRSENGGESRARAVMIEEGFAPHELQVSFCDPIEPNRTIRGDFGWRYEDGSWAIGELDGRQKYEDERFTEGEDSLTVMMAERRRESRLSAYGVRIMRFPMRYVYDRWKLIELMQVFGIPRSPIPLIP